LNMPKIKGAVRLIVPSAASITACALPFSPSLSFY
jgi:hypothetical protein